MDCFLIRLKDRWDGELATVNWWRNSGANDWVFHGSFEFSLADTVLEKSDIILHTNLSGGLTCVITQVAFTSMIKALTPFLLPY